MNNLTNYAFAIGYFSHQLGEPATASLNGHRMSWANGSKYTADLTIKSNKLFAFIDSDDMETDKYYALLGYCVENGINYEESL